jgi:hypothetical protein
MKKKIFTFLSLVAVAFVFLAPHDAWAAFKAESLLGKKTLNFNLSSTEDRPIGYERDYLGKHYLILTFFPAAFTPV